MTIETFNQAPVTAGDVRSFYRDEANAARLEALSEAAQNTVREGARGRLHPEVIADFNSDRKPSQRYTERNPRTVQVSYKHTQPSGRTVTKRVSVPETEARRLAGAVAGKRGPLSKAALAAAGEALGKSLSV